MVKEMILGGLTGWLLLITFPLNAQNTTFDHAIELGDEAFRKGQFQEAIRLYFAAEASDRENDIAKSGQVQDRVTRVFEQVEALRLEALTNERITRKQAITLFANDLALESRIALQMGDLNTAFRLAEFAFTYVDPNNPEVLKSLMDTYYSNQRINRNRLPLVSNIGGFEGIVRALAISADEKLIAGGGERGIVMVWDLETKELVREINTGQGFIYSLAFTPGRRKIISGGMDSTYCIWDLDTGSLERTFRGEEKKGASIAISSQANLLALLFGKEFYLNWGRFNSSVNLYDLNQGLPLDTLYAAGPRSLPDRYYTTKQKWMLSENFRSHTFSPDGRYLAVSTETGKKRYIKVWEIGTMKGPVVFEGAEDDIDEVAWAPNGNYLVGSCFGHNVYVWEFDTPNQPLHTLTHPTFAHGVSCSPDSKILATGCSDKQIRFWDMGTGNPLNTISGHQHDLTALIYSDEGERIYASDFSGDIRIWELEKNLPFKEWPGKEFYMGVGAFSPVSEQFAVTNGDSTLQILDLATNKVNLTLQKSPEPAVYLHFSDNGRFLACKDFFGLIQIWDLNKNELVKEFKTLNIVYDGLIFTPNGESLIFIDQDGTITQKWLDGTIEKTISPPGYIRYDRFALMDDGKSFIVGDSSGRVWIRNLETGTLQELPVPKDLGSVFAYSNHENLLFLRDAGKLTVWDLQRARAISNLDISQHSLYDIAFSPNGEYTALLFSDRVELVTNWRTGSMITILEGVDLGQRGIAFSPNGEYLINSGKGVKVFKVSGTGIIQGWRETGVQAYLSSQVLQGYSLQSLFDIHPENENKLIATREPWQIKAFADLEADLGRGSPLFQKAEVHFSRAKRLYKEIMNLSSHPSIYRDFQSSLNAWADYCDQEGLLEKANVLRLEASGLGR